MKAVLFVVSFSFACVAQAGTIQECNDARKQDIKQCNDDLEETSQKSATSNAALGEASTGVRIQGAGNVMSGAYNSEADRWSALASSCQRKLDDCRRKCQVEPQYQTYADQYIQQCKEKIGKVVQAANESARNSREAAIASTASSSSADDQRAAGEREIKSSRGSEYQDQVVGADGRRLPSDIAPEHIGDVEKVGSGPQGISFVDANGNRQVYYSSNVGDNLKANMNYLKGISGVAPAIMLPDRPLVGGK